MVKESNSGLVVAITGAAGYLAGRVIEQLCADDRVERVLGFDVRRPTFEHRKLIFDEVDVRNPALKSRFQGVDVVMHLAFVMDPIKDEALMRDVNLNGSQNVFRSAGEAGVKKVVYTSSGVAYGAHPDNDVPLTEDSPLRANLDFSYPAHKLEVEYVVKEIRSEYRDMTFTILRPAMVLGPHADSAWSHLFEMPIIFSIKGYSPFFQFVHEDDVAGALAFSVFEDLDGAYNVAPEGWMHQEEVHAIVDRPRIQLSEPHAFSLADRLWNAGLAEAPAGMLHYAMHSWVMGTDKLRSAGFSCSRSNEETLREQIARSQGFVRLGTNRVPKKTLAAGAALGLGLVGTAAAVRSVRARAGD